MWGVTITNKHFSKQGELIGVTVTVDNGDTQYMTIGSYDKFLKNRKKYGKKDRPESLGED
jgi:hypothetical protein